MSCARNQINEWLETIDVAGKTVLDVGAGAPKSWLIPPGKVGHITGVPKEYKTLDVNPEFGCDFVFDLNTPVGWRRRVGVYDYVFCLETLEHVWNPVQALYNLMEVTGGRLFISVPFVHPIHDQRDYLRYTFQFFETVLPRVGFTKVEIKQIEATEGREDLENFYRKEGKRMSKVTRQQGYGGYYLDVGYCVVATR